MLKLDAYKLKWIAIVGMALSHIYYAFPELIPFPLAMVLSAFGGVTFAIMAFFAVEGYRHTSNLAKYLGRLLIFGLIATPFHFLVIAMPNLNILFTIILGLIVLVLYDKIKIKVLFWLLYIIVIIPIATFYFEMMFIGVTMILLFHIIRNESARRIVPPLVSMALWLVLGAFTLWSISMNALLPVAESPFRNAHFTASADFMMMLIPFGIVCGLTSILLKGYNNERGKRMKWFFYSFYPAHFIVLAAIGIALGTISLSVFGF